ncbi:MAG: class I SAM-dependent RNA methyltransferase [Oligoflexia bacterium]|nr:class I SAM-dependent RNA methyltransferase [Oligoflexia bacterium]
MSFEVGQIVELSIDSLAHGGAGVGRLNDFVFFIPFTAPGDKVKAEIIEIKKNYAQAELKNILTPSSARAEAPCNVFGKCGGCQWQHVDYKIQLEQKQKTVEHALARIAKEAQFELKKIIPSPQEFNYRNRAQIRTQGPRLGFYSRNSHELVEFKNCHLLEPALNEELGKIRNEIKSYPDCKTSKIEMFLTQQNQIARSNNKSHGQEFGFSQVNTKQNENLQNLVVEVFDTPSEQNNNILDLFCGNGNFSFPLSKSGWDIYGVDLNKNAITQARSKATEKTFFSCNDCLKEIKKLALKGRTFKNILLDPPRIGCQEALLKNLMSLKPEKIVYISCNPTTFGRDWARIKAANPKFKLKWVQPLDMFPQTFHVELIALIELT